MDARNVNTRVKIVAEIGVNHDGSVNKAMRLVEAAAAAGADAVKFQSFNVDELVTASAPLARYQAERGQSARSQREMLERLALSPEAHSMVASCASRHGLEFASTAFDSQSLLLLEQLGVPWHKVPSGEITNVPLLRLIGSLGKPVIMSTGGSELSEVRYAISVLESAGTPRSAITLLHCTMLYPAPLDSVNLRAMVTLRDDLHVDVGYSDHSRGWEVDVAAVALGATVIEKHMTLNSQDPGPDHGASLEPAEFTSMVQAVRNTEAALGSGDKRPDAREYEVRDVARRSIVARWTIEKGSLIQELDLSVKRPGGGLSPVHWDLVVGSRAKRRFEKDDFICL